MSDTYQWSTYRDIAKEVRRIADIFNPDHRNFTILDLAARELESIDPYMTENEVVEEAKRTEENWQRTLAAMSDDERRVYEGSAHRRAGRARAPRADRQDRQSLLDAGERTEGVSVTSIKFVGLEGVRD